MGQQEKLPLPPAVMLRETLLYAQICKVSSLSDDEAIDHVGRTSGTTGGWQAMTEEDLASLNRARKVLGEDIAERYAVCDNDPDRVHFLVVC